jgi:hypothetical protein
MSTRGSRGGGMRTVCILGLSLIGAWGISSCQQAAEQGEPRATPRPRFSYLDSASRSAVLAYVAETLHFDSTRGAADEQRLVTDTLCDSTRALEADLARDRARMELAARKQLSNPMLVMGCTVGPRVRIDPEIGAYRIGRAGVREGRIIARMVNLEAIAYPKLNLEPHGTTYWWVDSAGRGGYRSVYVPANATVPLKQDTFVFHREPPDVRWRQAIARFVVVDKDDQVWTACDPYYCCNTTAIH